MKPSLLVLVLACGSSSEPASKPLPVTPPTATVAEWTVPEGWKSETIPFPLDFAPSLAHRGVEELRFAPGMFDPDKPGYWSYAFTWRTENAANLDAAALGVELTAYFKGLLLAVDETQKRITAPDEIVARATADGARFTLTAHIFDAFKTAAPVDLVGWAQRTPCGSGALWVFVFSPEKSPMRGELDTLARSAKCGQPTTK